MNQLLYIPEFFGFSIEVYVIILLLGIVLFYFWRWILKKFMTLEERKRIITTWLLTILSAPIAYAFIIIIWLLISLYHPSYEFDKQKWKTNIENRYELSDDIIDSQFLIGKTKSEVKQLLGEPDGWSQDDNWSYYLGYKPGIIGSIDPDYLDIEFKNNKVVKVGQHTS